MPLPPLSWSFANLSQLLTLWEYRFPRIHTCAERGSWKGEDTGSLWLLLWARALHKSSCPPKVNTQTLLCHENKGNHQRCSKIINQKTTARKEQALHSHPGLPDFQPVPSTLNVVAGASQCERWRQVLCIEWVLHSPGAGATCADLWSFPVWVQTELVFHYNKVSVSSLSPLLTSSQTTTSWKN